MPDETPPDTHEIPPHLEPFRAALAGQYAIERTLGAGGMGTVLLARDLTLDRRVAIKIVSVDVMLTAEVRERFLREARTVARLRHPNIVTVYTAGEAAGMLYFVMEHVDGESLRQRMAREGALPPEAARRLLCELADALQHAHAAGIIHRDLKPENVLLERSTGTARLTDFGVARAFAGTSDERLTGTGMTIGTPRYMSPEQATGEREIDGRSDVYSLGLLGYELLTGAPVFSGSGPTVIMKQITERPEPVAARVPSAPPVVAAAVDRALEKDPAARWSSAGAMREALEGVSIQPSRGGALPGRHRAAPFAALAALVLLALVGVGWWATRDPGADDGPRTILVLPFANTQRLPELEWLREGSVSMLTLDMAQWGDLSVVSFERTLDLVRSAALDSANSIGLEDAIQVAREAGARTVITGSIGQTADSLIATATAYDVRSRDRSNSARVALPRSADPRGLFDQLSQQLLGAEGSAFAARPGIAAQTTSSLEAYRHYLEGVRSLTSWRLDEADSAFALALAEDSTFALAYYKRSMTQGWRTENRDSTKLELARKAAQHSANLPEREKQLIRAYALFSEQDYKQSQAEYAQLVARDSADAEAWYGLADALYHDGQLTPSLRAFNRALVLDPALHLAYAHKVELFINAAHPYRRYVLLGDSVAYFRNEAEMLAIGSPARIDSLRRIAADSAVATARKWTISDPRAARSHFALANAVIVAGSHDSTRLDQAVQTLERALRDPAAASAAMPFRIATIRMLQGRTDALAHLRAALDSVHPDTLVEERSQHTVEALLGAMAVAAYGGSPATVDSMAALLEAVFPVTPVSGRPVPSHVFVRPLGSLMRVAMGDGSAESRRTVDESLAAIERAEAPVRDGLRSQYAALPYLAYHVFRDERYRAMYDDWTAGDPSHTLGAIAALSAGDTARALELATRLQGPASVSTPFSSALRGIAETAVLMELGEDERALATLDAIDTRYFDVNSPDVRWAFLPRSHLLRATLLERLGRRAEAAAAYRRFLDLWQNADPVLADHVRAARAGLGRVEDPEGR